MPTIRLTERGLSSLTAGRWLTDYWDRTLPGFGVRVSKTGHKSFVVRYTHDGSKHRVTIGPYPAYKLAEARDHVLAWTDLTSGRSEFCIPRRERSLLNLSAISIRRQLVREGVSRTTTNPPMSEDA